MAATKNTPNTMTSNSVTSAGKTTESVKQITYLAAALKAPRITEAAARLAAEGLRPDVIMLDPPRKGCDETTLSAVVQMSPRRVVYVSCNPSTAARDAAWLEEHGYHAEKVQPVDLFPRTRHCECVISLSKGEIDS